MLGQAERLLGVDLLYNLQEAIQKARPGFDVWVFRSLLSGCNNSLSASVPKEKNANNLHSFYPLTA